VQGRGTNKKIQTRTQLLLLDVNQQGKSELTEDEWWRRDPKMHSSSSLYPHSQLVLLLTPPVAVDSCGATEHVYDS